jgi:Fe-S-cluster containining protein
VGSQRRREEAAYEQVREVYDQVPKLRCKGLCHDSCTVAPASELELRKMHRETGFDLITEPPGRGEPVPRCPALGPMNTCEGYEWRPWVCRIFGLVVALRCDHGCVPENDQYIPLGESYRIAADIERLSREVTGVPSTPIPEDFGKPPRD